MRIKHVLRTQAKDLAVQAKDLALQAKELAVTSARSFTPTQPRQPAENSATTSALKASSPAETPEQRFKAYRGFVREPVQCRKHGYAFASHRCHEFAIGTDSGLR